MTIRSKKKLLPRRRDAPFLRRRREGVSAGVLWPVFRPGQDGPPGGALPFRFGIGYDVHRLVKGRALIIGGISIPFEKGLLGHSDADVLLHAICDALLGALGQGDIGEHFPPGDPRFKNSSSLVLLRKVMTRVKVQGYRVGQIDSVLLAERPQINPVKIRMRRGIARVLGIDISCVNIKATTQEGCGFIGRQEAMAAYATALLIAEQ